MSFGGSIVSVATAEEPLNFADIVAGFAVATGTVEMAKFAVVFPVGTVTVFGKLNPNAVELRLTMAPFPEAGAFSVTVPVLEAPPTISPGLTARLLTARGITVRT